MSDFCHLHVHTKYSLLDGLCKLDELMDRLKALSQSAVAITDHGNMFGVIEFYKSAKKAGIKPIIGCEVYIADKSRLERDMQNYHLILLCENNEGYRNLMKLVSFAYTEGFYYKPRIDFEILKEYSKGIICLTACLSGGFSKFLLNNNIKEAEEYLLKLKSIFGTENLFVELQDHNLAEQRQIINTQIELAKKHNINVVATNDVHYILKEDSFYQEILMCIQTQKTIADEDRMRFETNEFYLKSYDEMQKNFGFISEALENTVKIANRCNVDIEFGNYHLPVFKINENISHSLYLEKLCLSGLAKRYGSNSKLHEERLLYELDTINKMGFTDYFLICHDFIHYAKENNIPVGPGRGSAAGSIVAYVLEITNIDPIKYNLLFERFLNSERITMPDIDIDFCYERRGEVIDYVINKYGADKVSQIITFGTLGAKQAVRDVGRALAMPYNEVDAIAKLIPFELNITINDALKISSELRSLYESNDKVKTLIDISCKVEGLPRHCSTHAAGVVITDEPTINYVPLYKSDDIISTQFTMTTLEELGLLKMDFLGLRNLTVISDTIKMVKENSGVLIDINEIDYENKEVFNLFCQGDTDGVFQFESYGMRKFLRDFKPQSIEDLILATSIYRPGPMQEIPKLLANKENPNNISYECDELADILKLTYGCIIYQEQVMEIFKRLAGYSMGRADIVRRAMSKKKTDVLNKEEILFIEGCKQNNISEKISKKIFEQIKDFAKYAFNKSHAACYSYIAYQTAYLKHFHKTEFMAALLNSFKDNQNKIIQYIKTCEQLQIKVMPPMINKSFEHFYADGDKILFGLSAVKNVGFNLTKNIVEERKLNGEFTDFEDFISRMINKDINKRAIESLIKAGAFDSIANRLNLLKTYEIIIDSFQNRIRANVPGQLSLFENPENKIKKTKTEAFENKITKSLLKMEKEVLGIYVSSHPLAEYEDCIKKTATAYSFEISAINEENSISRLSDSDIVKIVGIIQDKKLRTTKKGQQMALFKVEDLYGEINVIAFPGQFAKYSTFISDDNIVLITGEISIKDEETKVILNEIGLFNPEIILQKLYLRINDRNKLNAVKKILFEHKGNTPVYVYFNDTKTNTIANKDMWVILSSTLIDRLKGILGEDNVVVV